MLFGKRSNKEETRSKDKVKMVKKIFFQVKFFALIAKGKSFDRAVFLCLPKKCLKQKLKRVAFALGIKK